MITYVRDFKPNLKVLRGLVARSNFLAAWHRVSSSRRHIHARARVVATRYTRAPSRVVCDFGEERATSLRHALLFGVVGVLACPTRRMATFCSGCLQRHRLGTAGQKMTEGSKKKFYTSGLLDESEETVLDVLVSSTGD